MGASIEKQKVTVQNVSAIISVGSPADGARGAVYQFMQLELALSTEYLHHSLSFHPDSVFRKPFTFIALANGGIHREVNNRGIQGADILATTFPMPTKPQPQLFKYAHASLPRSDIHIYPQGLDQDCALAPGIVVAQVHVGRTPSRSPR